MSPHDAGAARPSTATYLAELSLENFALVERVRVTLPPGFVVLTGETGVGKSILVDALKLLAGGRAATDRIRTGADRAVVEGVFRQVPLVALEPLIAAGAMVRTDAVGTAGGPGQDTLAELVVRRVVERDGNSAAYINDRRTSLGLLAEVTGALVDVQGQHAQQSLLSDASHGALLDAAGGLGQAAAGYHEDYQRWQGLDRRIAEARERRGADAARGEFLAAAVAEITAACLDKDEDRQLAEALSALTHADTLRTRAEAVYGALYGRDGAVLSSLQNATAELQEMAALAPLPDDLPGLIGQAEVQVAEAVDMLRRYRDQTRSDPDRVQQITERIAVIEGLKRKYGTTVAEVMAAGEAFVAEQANLAATEDHIAADERRLQVLGASLVAQAVDLEARRKRAATALTEAMAAGLARLGMPHARIAVTATPYTEGIAIDDRWLGTHGLARHHFALAANPGEPARPLGRVASGGELSRILLALKRALLHADPVPCLVFDEVDAGIGGAVAEQVGRMLRELARGHQVFCVTHLAQVASLAEHHLQVWKETDGHHTHTRVIQLHADQRVAEVARMLGGEEVTATTVAHAREMLATG